METEEFIQALNYALKNNYTFIFSCNCEVTYNGRAESYLPPGDRLIIIKNDKTLLVHQPNGSMPVNHMRTGGEHYLEQEGELLYLKSEHTKHKEELLITINGIHFHKTQPLTDDKKILTRGTEKDMSEMLYKNPTMIEKGFKPLNQEEHTKYGFIDVFGHDKQNNLVVVECKRQKADLNAVTQLRRYVERIKEAKGLSYVRGILASPNISNNALDMLKEWGYNWVMIEPPRFETKRDKKQKGLGEY